MKKHRNFLLVFVGLFTALLAIQVYFLVNSYELKKKEIYKQVHQKLNALEDDIDQFDYQLSGDDEGQKQFVALEKGEITKAELLKKFDNKNQKTSPKVSKYIDRIFAKSNYKIALQKHYKFVYSNKSKDTLLNKPVIIYSTKNPISSKALLFSTGKWETTSTTTETDDFTEEKTSKHQLENEVINRKSSKTDGFSFEVKRETKYEILNIKTVVFKELIVLFLLSFLILLSVILLYYKTFQNLLQQQQETQHLHNVVDTVSHEFKTPVATLKIAINALGRNYKQENIPLINRQIYRLEQLLERLNHPSSLNQEKVTLHKLAVILDDFELVNENIELHKNLQFAENIQIDQADLEIILLNILENSVKYGARKIFLNITQTKNRLEINIADDGIGISKKEQKSIFEKFYRVDYKHSNNTKGLGLGLYLVKETVQLYSGKIEVESDLNKGATFKITLHENH